jgi:hypothetical protein
MPITGPRPLLPTAFQIYHHYCPNIRSYTVCISDSIIKETTNKQNHAEDRNESVYTSRVVSWSPLLQMGRISNITNLMPV